MGRALEDQGLILDSYHRFWSVIVVLCIFIKLWNCIVEWASLRLANDSGCSQVFGEPLKILLFMNLSFSSYNCCNVVLCLKGSVYVHRDCVELIALHLKDVMGHSWLKVSWSFLNIFLKNFELGAKWYDPREKSFINFEFWIDKFLKKFSTNSPRLILFYLAHLWFSYSCVLYY